MEMSNKSDATLAKQKVRITARVASTKRAEIDVKTHAHTHTHTYTHTHTTRTPRTSNI